MRLLVFTDLQATEGRERCNVDRNTPLQRWRVNRLFEFLKRVYDEKRCDALVDLGDTTNEREFVYTATIDSISRGLNQFRPNKHGIKLTGNHEQLLKSSSIDTSEMYRPYFGHLSDGKIMIGNTSVSIFSFPSDYAELSNSISNDEPSRKSILLGHFDVVGSKYASGETVSSGVPLELLSKYGLVLLGHIHNHQRVKDNVYYVGSPFQQDFGEAHQPKFVCVVDTDTLEVEWIQTSFPEYKVVTLEKFLSTASEQEEHRYSVILNSIDESNEFYASPKCWLGIPKPMYTAVESVKLSTQSKATTDEDYIRQYVEKYPIKGLSGELDLAEIGIEFAKEN